MTIDDLQSLTSGQTLLWRKNREPGVTAEVYVEYLYPAENRASGRIWVRLPSGQMRSVSIRNCTVPPAVAQ